MKRAFNRSILVISVALLLAPRVWAADKAPEPKPAPNGGRAASLSDLFGDPAIARGQGVEIKRSQLEDAFTAWKANLAARGQTIGEEQRTLREFQLLDKLIV